MKNENPLFVYALEEFLEYYDRNVEMGIND
jgi:hypothetical protein